MKKNLFIIGQILIVLWLLFVAFIYFFDTLPVTTACGLEQGCIKIGHFVRQIQVSTAHSYYFDALKASVGLDVQHSHVINPIIFILVGILFLYFANFLYEKFINKKDQLELKLSGFLIFIIFTVIFFICYQCWMNFYNLNTPIKFTSIFVRFPLILAQVGVIAWLCLAVGRKIIKQFEYLFGKILDLKDDLAEFLFSFAFGLMAIIFLLFLLALFKLLFFKYVLALFIIIAVLTWDQLWFWLKSFFEPKITFKSGFFDLRIFLYILVMIFVAHNILELMRPIPIGFDDMTSYINTPKTLAQEGYLLSGVMSYYWELFSSIGAVLFRSINVSLLLSSLQSGLALLAVYFVTNFYFKARGFLNEKAQTAALLCATIFYTTPMVSFMASRDLKVDLSTVFFCALALFSFWQWRQDFSKNKKSNHWLYLSALLVGFATAVKLTNLLFCVILGIYLVWTIFNKYHLDWKKYLIVLWFILIAMAPFAPIGIRNIYQTRSLSVASIRLGKPLVDSLKIDPPFSGPVPQANYAKYMRYNSTGNHEEAGRYLGYTSWWKKYSLLILNTTTNFQASGVITDFGFLFLALAPLACIFYFIGKKNLKKKTWLEISVLAVVFWLAWVFLCTGIIWYGLSGFILLLMLLVEAIYYMKENGSRFVYYFLIVYVVFWLICAIAVRTSFLLSDNIAVDPAGLRYARGEYNEQMYLDAKFQPYFNIINSINQDIDTHLNHPPIVYMIGTYYKYMIDYNDRTVLSDNLLDKFAYAYQDKDPVKTMQRMKNTGIKYIIVDRALMTLDSTPSKSLMAKGTDWYNFIEQNQSSLQLLTNELDQKIMIFKVVN